MRRSWSQILTLVLVLYASSAHAQTSLVFNRAWGSTGTGPGQFQFPFAIGVDATGHVYVADGSRIQVFTSDGTFLSQFQVDVSPNALGVDAGGLVHIFGLTGGSNGQGEFATYTTGGAQLDIGYFAGLGCECTLHFGGLAMAPNGDEFYADWGTYHPSTCNPPCPTTVARVNTGSGSWGTAGTGPGQLTNPNGVAIDAGNVYVSDAATYRVQKYMTDGTFLGQWGSQGSGNGQFLNLAAIAASASGHVYTLDQGSRIQDFTSDGAYLGRSGTVGSGPPQLSIPLSIAADAEGNVYVADTGNDRVVKFSPPSTPTRHSSWGQLKTHYH
jgi:sugar lactone lactonase YvrE